MAGVKIRSLEGTELELGQTDIDRLRAELRGPLLLPGDRDYERSRAVWNGMIDRRPGMIVRCIGAADVMACVDFARERRLLMCIRGGGHNISGLAVADGALMLDMRHLKGVHVDLESGSAYCQAGCTLGDVDRDTQLRGLAAVLGFVSNTGIAGLTLGGGFGYLTRRYGWTTDNVRSIELVTPDGRLRRVSESVDADLFWGLRGGGGNFGVVTRIEYELHPVGPTILGGAIAWPFEAAGEVLGLCREINEKAPPELVVVGAVRRAPPAPWLPADVHGELIVVLFVCDTGSLAEARDRVAPIKSFGKPLGDVVQERPYTSQQSLLDATQPDGRRNYWKSEYLSGMEEGLLEAVVEHSRRIVSPHSAILLFPLHGKLNELPEDHSAVGNRQARTVFNVAASWEDPADDEANIGWARQAWSAMREFSTGGTYVNFLTEEEGDARIRDAYGANYDRLVALKRKYDPENLLRTNKNVAPD